VTVVCLKIQAVLSYINLAHDLYKNKTLSIPETSMSLFDGAKLCTYNDDQLGTRL
jgi:hypothetical protein